MNNLNSSPNLEEAFNKQNTCTMCYETFFMCDCKDDLPDYESMDDEWED